jgi:chromosomal replication initiator protein
MSKRQHINDHVRFRTAVQAVSNVTGIKRRHILGQRRFRRYIDARHMAMQLVRQSTKLNLTSIGRLFERDHSTVIHASNSVKSLIDISDNYRDEFNQIVSEYDRLIKELQPDAIEVVVE